MKASNIKKWTFTIETTNGNDISTDVMNYIASLQKMIASQRDLKLSYKEEQLNSIDKYSPAGWDYWPV